MLLMIVRLNILLKEIKLVHSMFLQEHMWIFYMKKMDVLCVKQQREMWKVGSKVYFLERFNSA